MPKPDTPFPTRQSLPRKVLGVVLGVVLIAACCLAAYLLWGFSLHLLSGGEFRGRGFAAPAVLAALFLSMLFMSQCLIAFLPTPGSWWTRILVPRRPVEP